MTELPRRLWRYPTAKAIANLAAHSGPPNTPLMQDR
jgi:hypothetical protein